MTADTLPSSRCAGSPGAGGSPSGTPLLQEMWVLHPDGSSRCCLQHANARAVSVANVIYLGTSPFKKDHLCPDMPSWLH